MAGKLSRFSEILTVLTVLKILFVLALFLSLILWSIPILSFNSGLWLYFQERTGVLTDVSNVTSYNERTIDFFFSNGQLNFLNESERSHMEAVKNVILIANGLAVASFVILISHIISFRKLSKTYKRFLVRIVNRTSLIVFLVTFILAILALSNFYESFFLFHQIIFVKNFIFPPNSILKILYSDEFFLALSALYFVSIIIASLVIFLLTRKVKV